MSRKQPRNRPVLILAAGSGLLLLAVWFGVRRLAETEALPGGIKIAAIAGASGLCLLLALAWLWPVVRRRGNQVLGSAWILFLAYILPVLALTLPLRLAGLLLPSADVLETWHNWLRPGPPWLLIIQGSLLAAALLPRGLRELQSQTREPIRWIPALLTGIGLWLLSALTFSLLARQAGQAGLPEPLPGIGLFVVAIAGALVILPLAEELFFRKILPDSLAASLSVNRSVTNPSNRSFRSGQTGLSGRLLSWGITAALFATLQARPLLWLPAFFLSLGLSALAEHTGRLRECVLAHAAFNLLALALNWATIL